MIAAGLSVKDTWRCRVRTSPVRPMTPAATSSASISSRGALMAGDADIRPGG
jgi:hypothetical protein